MSDWDHLFHETHTPAEPRNIGFGTGLVYCRACGALLRSDRGPAHGTRVMKPCEPVPISLRATVPTDPASGDTTNPLGFAAT